MSRIETKVILTGDMEALISLGINRHNYTRANAEKYAQAILRYRK